MFKLNQSFHKIRDHWNIPLNQFNYTRFFVDVFVCKCLRTLTLFFHSFFSLSFFRNKYDLLRLCGIVQSLQVVQIQSKNDYNAGTLSVPMSLCMYIKPTCNSAYSIVLRSHIILPVDLCFFFAVVVELNEFKTLSNLSLFISSIPIIFNSHGWSDRISVILALIEN